MKIFSIASLAILLGACVDMDAGSAPSTALSYGPGSDNIAAELGECTLHVSPGGSDDQNGTSVELAVRTVPKAASLAGPGDVVCLSAGAYAPFSLSGIKGSASQPVVIRSQPGSEDDVVIRDSNGSQSVGVYIYDSSYIILANLTVRDTYWGGINMVSVDHGIIVGNKVINVGQDGIKIGRRVKYTSTSKNFDGPPASYCSVIDNQVIGTGKTEARSEYGEGIYIGTGAISGDETHHILVRGNIIKDTTAEAIELKPFTHDIDVIDNQISDVSLNYSGAITVAVTSVPIPNGHYNIIGNSIDGVTTRRGSIGGIVVGHGDTVVSCNRIKNVEGGRSIRVYTDFKNSSATKVDIFNNVVSQRISLRDGNGSYGGGVDPVVSLDSNLEDADVDAAPTHDVCASVLVDGAAELAEAEPSLEGESIQAPSNLRGQVYSSTALEIFWDRVTTAPVSHYEIWRNGSKIAERDALSYFDSDLAPNTSYAYQIIAVDTQGERSQESLTWTGQTKPLQ